MSKAWIHDKWLKYAQVTTADGHCTKMEPPPSAKHSLAMFADEQGKAKVSHNRAVQRRIYLTPQEIKTIAGQMDEANATVVYLLAYTGLRIGEALALRCGDVDLGRNRINVLRTQSVDANYLLVETLPKGNRTRFVPIPSQLLPRVEALLDGHGPEDYLLRGPWGGRQNTANWRNRVWAPALQDAGMKDIEGLVIHSLRHTYASLAIKAGGT